MSELTEGQIKLLAEILPHQSSEGGVFVPLSPGERDALCQMALETARLRSELEAALEQIAWPRCPKCNSELQDQGEGRGKVCLLCNLRDDWKSSVIRNLKERAERAESLLAQRREGERG